MNEMVNSSEDLRSLPPRPPAAPLKRRFARLGRKRSDGSELSASSTGSSSPCRSAEGAAVRQPSKGRVRRHTNRLSGVFLRGPAPSAAAMSLTAGLKSTLLVQARKGSMIATDALAAEDPSELSNQITAPGILKIFGNEICEGAHYKSVLATTHSSAKELVKEALERYGLSKAEAEAFVLCDTIGTTGATGSRQWRTEGFRVVGDHERPLLLQSLWKPREGLARRFEIQRRSSVEEKTSREKDTVTAGINAQARKLQKSRSRVTSTFLERTVGRNQKLWRSKSEMDLLDAKGEPCAGRQRGVEDRSGSLTQRPEQNGIQGPVAPPEGDGEPRAKKEGQCPEAEESEREETESSGDGAAQYSIHPPHDCPYLLLLQGRCLAQDFLVYLLAASNVTIGQSREGKDGARADIVLSAPDILPMHCRIHRDGSGTSLAPCRGAAVTRNSEVLKGEVQLCASDVIGVGQHYLFLFKDPQASRPKEVNGAPPEPGSSAAPWMLGHAPPTAPSNPLRETLLCSTCMSTGTGSPGRKRSPGADLLPFLTSPEGQSLTISYRIKDEECIVKEVIALGSADGDGPPLAASFLLCMCVQHSAAHLGASDLRGLLLLIASEVQSAVWEQTKDLSAVHSELLTGDIWDPEDLHAISLTEVMAGLRPLVVWMSNSLELLQVVQYQLPLIVEWRARKEEDEEEGDKRSDVKNLAPLELRLSCMRSATEEMTAVLEEVVMLAFQQCVYYVTKLLYPVLPGLLDCNPFRESPDRREAPGDAGRLPVPGEIRRVLEVLTETWTLLSDCQVHPEISSQLVGYLFYFINALLFNSLMERGSEPGFYQWSRGVRMRANLDLLLDWAHAAGLAELASEHTHVLSSAINLLATPRKNLLQAPWASLRSDHPALSPAQLNHLLTLYRPAPPSRHTWTPSAQEQAATLNTADILESFDTHHPLVLPDGGYQLQLRRPVADVALREQLDSVRQFISSLSDTTTSVSAAEDHQDRTVQMEPKPSTDVHPSDGVEAFNASPRDSIPWEAPVQHHAPVSTPPAALPPSPPSPSLAHSVDELSSCGAHVLSQKLRNLTLQTGELTKSSPDPSCLLTPPNTPHLEAPGDLRRGDKWTKTDEDAAPWTSAGDLQDEGGLVFECLAALRADHSKPDCSSMKRLVELKEEEEEEQDEEEEEEEEEEDDNDEVFSLELERGENGLGLALVDTRDTPMKVKGVFIRAVVPDSPAARCEKLLPGDRILAVNGVSLLGLDYQGGKELIQSSGVRLRLLVARSEWMVQAIRTEC